MKTKGTPPLAIKNKHPIHTRKKGEFLYLRLNHTCTEHCVLNVKYPGRLMCLYTWSPANDTVCDGYKMFRRYGRFG